VRHVLLGGGGLLGTGVRAVLAARRTPVVRLRPPWGDLDALPSALEAALQAELADDRPTTLVWAAGVGHVGASATAMRAETTALETLCRAVLALPAQRRAGLSVLFASSAGALYAAHGDARITPDSPPSPTSAYGHVKLSQEQLLGELAEDAGCRVVLARISNLYGLADGVLTARGLVSTAVRATRLRQPMTVFVRQDTRRDYVFHRDAAAVALRHVETAPAGLSTALVCDGTTRSVTEVLAVVGAVCGRRVPATFAERPETRLQPYVLRFATSSRGPDDVRRTPMEAAVHLMARAPMAH
jgi:UDP-glucose 4-epimerase